MENEKKNPAGLLPMLVFLVLYLGLGIIFEYVMKIEMGFYNIPIVLIILVALLVACVQNRAVSLDEKLVIMGKGIGDKNIITMILIFDSNEYIREAAICMLDFLNIIDAFLLIGCFLLENDFA